jgi:hypothetical protein
MDALSADVGSIIVRYIKHPSKAFPENTKPFVIPFAEE